MGHSTSPAFLAFDLGAESGRAMAGIFADGRLRLEELHRFPNSGVRVGAALHWDVLALWRELQRGLALAAQRPDLDVRSLGVDTWGVDFALLAADDTLIGNPYHYRDARTNGMMELAFRNVPRETLYAATGVQFMQLNTLYQLLALVQTRSPQLEIARTFLTIPDLFNFWLTGRKVNEFTIATTTQCYDPRAETWAWAGLEQLGIPTALFGEIVPAGAILGPLRPELATMLGCAPVPVVAPACHDTGSAVAAVPAQGSEYIYLSSGTWSLMGIESPTPIITPETLAAGLTNEGGVGGSFRILKNIMGLWLVQECRRSWARGGMDVTYADLTRMAEGAPAFSALIRPDDPRFLAPPDMPAAIRDFCRETGQTPPENPGAMMRCALESLALEYRRVAEALDALAGRRLPVIHIIGGGSQNRLLNQFTADATGRLVIAGPVEATAIGNILVQALALGELRSLEEGRALVRASFPMETFAPRADAAWEEAYARYCRLSASAT